MPRRTDTTLALGTSCVLHDRGTRRPLSKTQYFGVPLVRYVLTRWWLGYAPELPVQGPHGGPGPSRTAEFAGIFSEAVLGRSREAGEVRRRLDYFGRYADPESGVVRFEAAAGVTLRDGDRAFYRGLARGASEKAPL